MKKILLACFMLLTGMVQAQTINASNTDVYSTSKGDVSISLLGHSSLILQFEGQVIHVDPFSAVIDYSTLPKADLIILTHEHSDHLDQSAIDIIKTSKTQFIVNGTCYDVLKLGKVLKNGDKTTFKGIPIEAIPAYNMVHKRPDGVAYHPQGVGNGYIFTFGDMRLYIAGDTENIPEMKPLKDIDIAFLPMNLPYTMTPEMVADAAEAFKPKTLYPYHHGGKEDLAKLQNLLKDKGIKIVIKNNGEDVVKWIGAM